MLNLREMLSERERAILSEHACFSCESKGREFPISRSDTRAEFQRDRDKIIHCKAFRRLMYKTQVFLSPEADHYRTRLTHTLEVTQIGRTVARALRLNEDLVEAIGLGHDLGHTPFGHAGERVLKQLYGKEFSHYKQSLRVVEKLEPLNLTFEVREGIVTHTHGGSTTLEGQIIPFADRIAYINHDVDDALRANVLSPDDIPRDIREVLGSTHGERIDTMVASLITASSDYESIRMSPEVREAYDALHDFLFDNVYKSPVAKAEEGKAEELVSRLYTHFHQNPDRMPEEYRQIAESEGVGRAVCDYISGMTDRYAINLFRRLFIPELWDGRVIYKTDGGR